MKVGISVTKRGAVVYRGVHDIIDQDTFSRAFGEVWREVRQRRLEATTSVGELMDILNDEVLDQLSGAKIEIEKAG